MNSKGLYIGASINIAQAQCKSTKNLHYEWPPILFPFLFYLDQLYPCGHTLPTSCHAYILYNSAVQAHSQPESWMGIRVISRLSVGSAALSTRAIHNVHIGRCTNLPSYSLQWCFGVNRICGVGAATVMVRFCDATLVLSQYGMLAFTLCYALLSFSFIAPPSLRVSSSSSSSPP